MRGTNGASGLRKVVVAASAMVTMLWRKAASASRVRLYFTPGVSTLLFYEGRPFSNSRSGARIQAAFWDTWPVIIHQFHVATKLCGRLRVRENLDGLDFMWRWLEAIDGGGESQIICFFPGTYFAGSMRILALRRTSKTQQRCRTC